MQWRNDTTLSSRGADEGHPAQLNLCPAAAVFFILSQSGERPERYIESLRFDTMPSSPILQAWAKMVGPSPSICVSPRQEKAP
jgi:hypothetical protein